MGEVDTRVFNPEWGIDVKNILSPITLPSAQVIQTALDMYQTEFRKPSFTVFCLDFSGSMKGEGDRQLKHAMALLLDQNQAKKYMLSASSLDQIIVIPFSGSPKHVWNTTGNDPQTLSALLKQIQDLTPGGKTDIYTPARKGLELMTQKELDKYHPSSET